MEHSRPRPWLLPLAAAVLTLLLALAIIAAQLTRGGDRASSSTPPLATACENFARASQIFATGGSEESLRMTDGEVFARDPQADAQQILDDLMAACARERAAP